MSANFTPTTAELALVNQIFAQADSQKLGILTGDVAVRVFGGAKLPGSVLGEIWTIADEDNNGWLPRKGVAIALRLIAHAQKGEKVTPTLLSKPAPLPTIEGYSIIAQQNTGMSIPKSPPPGFPPLSPQDKIKFQNIFNRSGPVNGLLNGEKARDIFLKSKLSNDQLMQIWNLADTRDRGSLDSADFTVAMYFIQGLMSQQISFVPSTLPPGLYEQAGGHSSNAPPSVTTHLSGNSGSLSPISSTFSSRISTQYTGQNQTLAPDNTGLSSHTRVPALPVRPVPGAVPPKPGSTIQGNGHDVRWAVTPAEKTEADSFFDGLDSKRIGYIEGDAAVSFMLKSQLPGEDLAQIWDLADINGDGRLTRDGFAVALHLIKKRLSGQPIPARLPLSLIPPSARGHGPHESPFQTQPEPSRDLLDFDDTPPASSVSPQITGILNTLQTQSTGATAIPPVPARSALSDPFASSSFGPSSHQDLLSDHEDQAQTSSPPLQDQSAEIGNIKNQLQSTNRSLETARGERAKMENALTVQAAELSALQTQLLSAKAAYDTETQLLSQLKERYTTQTNEIQKSREELIRAESELSAIRVEKAEIEQSLLRDKEEARDLHRRMIDAGQQADQLKTEVEKAKKEAKQQKGRLAIARKQLSTKETEKAKMEKELEEATAEVKSITQEAEDVEAQLLSGQPEPEHFASPDSVAYAAAHPLPVSPDPAAPSKSNNPFERLAKTSASSTPQTQSPFLPFSNVPLTSPPIGPSEGQNGQAKLEPQSFDEFFGVSEPEELSRPTQIADVAPKDINNARSPNSPTDTENFMTPPTTAAEGSPSGAPENLPIAAQATFPSVDDAAAQFPPVNSMASTADRKDANSHTMTDLDTKLQEIEIEESDSDSDDDSPLAEVMQKAREKSSTPVAQPAEAAAAAPSMPPQSEPSFDDIFGSNDTPAVSVPPGHVSKLDSGPIDNTTTDKPVEQVNSNATAGVNAFDETLGGFPAPPSVPQGQFLLDAFEDSFDFSAAGGTQLPPTTPLTVLEPAPAPAPITTNAATTNDTTSQPSFDTIFGTPGQDTQASFPPTNGNATGAGSPKLSTFEGAFGGFDTGPNLSLDASFTSMTSANVPAAESASSSKPYSASPTPASPKTVDTSSPRPSVNQPSSPAPRPVSPGRTTSSKARLSISKESHEKLKEPPAKHSKLSIRLPFGKKKNKPQEPMPPPPSHLSSPPDGSRKVTSPGGSDDVEAVKQIIAMGFTRAQAVAALENHGYDLTRAINSLL